MIFCSVDLPQTPAPEFALPVPPCRPPLRTLYHALEPLLTRSPQPDVMAEREQHRLWDVPSPLMPHTLHVPTSQG